MYYPISNIFFLVGIKLYWADLVYLGIGISTFSKIFYNKLDCTSFLQNDNKIWIFLVSPSFDVSTIKNEMGDLGNKTIN